GNVPVPPSAMAPHPRRSTTGPGSGRRTNTGTAHPPAAPGRAASTGDRPATTEADAGDPATDEGLPHGLPPTAMLAATEPGSCWPSHPGRRRFLRALPTPAPAPPPSRCRLPVGSTLLLPRFARTATRLPQTRNSLPRGSPLAVGLRPDSPRVSDRHAPA